MVKRGGPVGRGGEGEVTTFLFTEFSEDCGAKELYNVFKEYGNVDEVIIPPKKDVRGKRYGFVRFFDMGEAEFLAKRLDSIFIGRRKLHVNIPKHNRRSVKEQSKGKEAVHHAGFGRNVQHNAGRDRRIEVGHGDGWGRRTYAQVTTQTRVKQKSVFTHMEYNRKVEDLVRFERAYVGVVGNSGTTYNIQESFILEGYSKIKATPLGANLCLLEENEPGELEFLVKESKEWLEQWFKEVHR